MKKILLLMAIFSVFFSTMAANGNLGGILSPTGLLLQNNEKVCTVDYVIATDSGFLVITKDNNLLFNERPDISCNEVIIVNEDTMTFEKLCRNSDILTLIIFFSVTITLIFLLIFTAILISKRH